MPAVAGAVGRVGRRPLVAVTPQLLPDDLHHALEGQPHRQPRDLLNNAQQLAIGPNQLVVSAPMASVAILVLAGV